MNLLPCPFCGGKAHMARHHDVDGMLWIGVECGECRACGKKSWCHPGDDDQLLYSEVRESWNGRTGLPAAAVVQSGDTDIHDAPVIRSPSMPLDLKTDPALLERLRSAAHTPEAVSPPREPTEAQLQIGLEAYRLERANTTGSVQALVRRVWQAMYDAFKDEAAKERPDAHESAED